MDNKIAAYILLAIGGINLLVWLGGSGGFFSLIVGGFLTYAGIKVFQRGQRAIKGKTTPYKQLNFEITDEMIVRLAKRLGGKLSVEELNAQTSLNADQAKERLEKLLMQGKCDIDVTDEGRIIYKFY